MHTKSQLAAIVTRWEQQEITTDCGSEFENQKSDILTLTKGAMVLICDSTGRSEILG